MSSSTNEQTSDFGFTEQESRVFKLLLGFTDDPRSMPQHTLEEVATQLGISVEEVVAIKDRALEKMLTHVHEKRIALMESKELEQDELRRIMEEPPV